MKFNKYHDLANRQSFVDEVSIFSHCHDNISKPSKDIVD